jgi:nicotinamide mononucleotide transporter
VLSHFTDSNVPVADAFTTALSLVGIWALAHKYLEQWLVWIAVDVVSCWLYFLKDIPFKASLYGLYVVIAVAGFWRWRCLMNHDVASCQSHYPSAAHVADESPRHADEG